MKEVRSKRGVKQLLSWGSKLPVGLQYEAEGNGEKVVTNSKKISNDDSMVFDKRLKAISMNCRALRHLVSYS